MDRLEEIDRMRAIDGILVDWNHRYDEIAGWNRSDVESQSDSDLE